MQAGERACMNRLQEIDDVFLTFHKPIKLLTQQAENYFTDMIKIICCKIIGHQVGMNNEFLMNMIRDAIELLPPSDEEIIVYLHPINLEAVQQIVEKNNFTFRSLRLMPDEQISVGSCKVSTKYSVIDASFASQIDKILMELSHRE